MAPPRRAARRCTPVVALTAALKCGFVFLIARRLMPDGVPRVPFAIVAALLLWLPYTFFAGSFMEQSFLSQVGVGAVRGGDVVDARGVERTAVAAARWRCSRCSAWRHS